MEGIRVYAGSFFRSGRSDFFMADTDLVTRVRLPFQD
jgi:hypothetical protein